jgi:hypothetical protein
MLLFHLKDHEKNKQIGRLMLYSISSSSEVIRKNVQNVNCWFSTKCDVISWVSMFIEYYTEA